MLITFGWRVSKQMWVLFLPEKNFLLVVKLAKVYLKLIVLLLHHLKIAMLLFYGLLYCSAVTFINHNFSPFFDLIYLLLLTCCHLLQLFDLAYDSFLLLFQLLHSHNIFIDLFYQILSSLLEVYIILGLKLDFFSYIICKSTYFM